MNTCVIIWKLTFLDIYTIKCFSMFNIFNSYAQIYTKPSVLIP